MQNSFDVMLCVLHQHAERLYELVSTCRSDQHALQYAEAILCHFLI